MGIKNRSMIFDRFRYLLPKVVAQFTGQSDQMTTSDPSIQGNKLVYEFHNTNFIIWLRNSLSIVY